MIIIFFAALLIGFVLGAIAEQISIAAKVDSGYLYIEDKLYKVTPVKEGTQ